MEYSVDPGDLMSILEFQLIDVFAEEKFQGNQLAVFLYPKGLSTELMQKIAKEMNLSETTFVLKRDDSTGKPVYETRIFTVKEELPFAGHPTLGTSYVISRISGEDEVTLRLKVGDIHIVFEDEVGDLYGEMTQNEPVFGNVHDPEEIAETLNLPVERVDERFPVQTVSTGNPFIIVPIRALDDVRNLSPDYKKMEEYLNHSDAKFMYIVTQETVKTDAILHARMLFYGGEDPATGSAAGPATAWMVKNNILDPDKQAWIEQGLEMGRPSRIFVKCSVADGNPSNIRVGGHCVFVASGVMEL